MTNEVAHQIQHGRLSSNVSMTSDSVLTSLRLLLRLALYEGHMMYCLWPLSHVLFVCTTLVCVLFVTTPTCTIC